MTNLSPQGFMKYMLEEMNSSILFTSHGEMIRCFGKECEWNLGDKGLQAVVLEAITYNTPVYRYIPVTKQDGQSERVLVNACPLTRAKEKEVPTVLVNLTSMNYVDQYQHNAELLDAAIEMIHEAIVITDRDNKILSVNGAFEKLTGYTLEELHGKNPHYLSAGLTSIDRYKEMWNSLLADGEWEGEVWDRRKDGTVYPKLLNISTIKDQDGFIVNFIGVFTDISERKEIEKMIDTLAQYDALTQLPNRRHLDEQLAFLTSSNDNTHQKIGLLLVDIDRFKLINDSLGYTAGDRLLLEMSERISTTLRKNDIVGRIGGDEFLIIVPMVQEVSDVIEVAEKLLEVFMHPAIIDEQFLYTSASIGISFFPSDGETIDAVVQHAEQAMYMAKKRGGKCYELFNAASSSVTLRRLMIENDLHRGIPNQEFRLVYQPQIDAMNGKIVGVEALIRWVHIDHGMISPVEFIPIAEESGFILELGAWVMREAMAALQRWLKAGLEPIRMAINVSARQFAHPDFVSMLKKMIGEYQIPPHLIELEVTESAVMEEPHRAIQICEELQQYGIEFAIDDFGTGYSSLAYLKLFPVKRLKIDKTFVDSIGEDTQSSTLAEVIMALGSSLQMEVIAEGVETLEQLQFLRERGCDIIQGYYYSPPKEEKTILEYLVNRPFETVDPEYPIEI